MLALLAWKPNPTATTHTTSMTRPEKIEKNQSLHDEKILYGGSFIQLEFGHQTS